MCAMNCKIFLSTMFITEDLVYSQFSLFRHLLYPQMSYFNVPRFPTAATVNDADRSTGADMHCDSD